MNGVALGGAGCGGGVCVDVVLSGVSDAGILEGDFNGFVLGEDLFLLAAGSKQGQSQSGQQK